MLHKEKSLYESPSIRNGNGIGGTTFQVEIIDSDGFPVLEIRAFPTQNTNSVATIRVYTIHSNDVNKLATAFFEAYTILHNLEVSA